MAEVLITEAYIQRFTRELNALAPKLKVKIEKTQSQKGKSPYKVVLDTDNGNRKKPELILSEGEQRIVALAAFFADATGRNELKERSLKSKRYMIEAHIIPYFGDRKVKDITASDIIQWQNIMREKGFAQTCLRMIQNQMTALFTHAYNIYGLSVNPCKKVKKMGKSDANKLNFWTKEEYGRGITVAL